MKYLDEISCFKGTGQKNEAGQTLEEFLEAYDPRKYDCPCNTVDIAVFKKNGAGKMQLLMIRRRNHPNIGYWALPGGFVEIKENLEDAAARELMEETGVTGISLKQHGAWGDYDRDPRWRVITALYFTILEEDVPVQAGDDAADAGWFDVEYEETFQHAVDKEAEGDKGVCAPDADIVSRIRLGLKNPVTGLALEASATCSQTGEGPLRQHHLRPETTGMIAGDHALMIMDLVKYICSFT